MNYTDYERLRIDDFDGPVTLFKSTDEGTETIAVFDEEYRQVIREMISDYNRMCKEYMELKYVIVGQSIAPATREQITDRCVNLTHEELIEDVLGYSPWI